MHVLHKPCAFEWLSVPYGQHLQTAAGDVPMSAPENASLVRRHFAESVSGASGPDQARALAVLDEP